MDAGFHGPQCIGFRQRAEKGAVLADIRVVGKAPVHRHPQPVRGPLNIARHGEGLVTPTGTGVELRTTETIDIFGDLNGRVLYHPETVIDETAGTLVNTGKQVFSGSVLGEGPFLMLDEFFRVDVNLVTGETNGTVVLVDPLDGSGVQCVLRIVGTGQTEEGNGMADYTGRCRYRGQNRRGLR